MVALTEQWRDPLVRTEGIEHHPSGRVDLAELSDLELDAVGHGGVGTAVAGTFGCCWCVPWYSSFTKCGLVCSAKCKW